MKKYQQEFIEFLVQSEALKFGSFMLKSGRNSPYFFNSGAFSSGEQIRKLGYYYAAATRELEQQPSVIFGPAYKGVPLCIAAAISLQQDFECEIAYTFDRKQEKTHGDGGWLVGHIPESDDTVVIVDDVVTDGATKVAAIQMLRTRTPATVTGLVIALDRKERNDEGGDSVTALAEKTGIEIRAVITIDDVLAYLPEREIGGRVVMTATLRDQVQAYLAEYGVT